jgi:ABC-type multidrug transport system ATPase subunit
MLAIGRAMMSAPEILLLDEPSLGLSPILAHELFQALGRVRETGVGVLLVEQNARQSLAISDRGYLIETGRIVGHGEARDLAVDPAVREAYLGAHAVHLRALPDEVATVHIADAAASLPRGEFAGTLHLNRFDKPGARRRQSKTGRTSHVPHQADHCRSRPSSGDCAPSTGATR